MIQSSERIRQKFTNGTVMRRSHVLITGGAGFVGSNLTRSLLADGMHVTVVDSLARLGSKHNLDWLKNLPGGDRLRFVEADVRDYETLERTAADVDVIYHIAGQVAVTTSVDNPREDFEVNALGTFNVLEAARASGRRPIVVFTSTNKVYGGLEDLEVIEGQNGYRFQRLPNGVPETRPLDFHSPYGCSKGTADQYVRDYARIYDLPTVVFRMSCIYGPRQFGTEDQGWLAHFMIAARMGRPITIYGDGKQVRDVLYVDDLVRALRLAVENIDRTAGQVFNIGGGARNALSVWSEFQGLIESVSGHEIEARYDKWRPGDQPCYISDIRKAQEVMGWTPAIRKIDGIRLLWDWIGANSQLFRPAVAGMAGAAGG